MWRQQQRQSAVSSSDWVVDILWIPICASGVTSSAEWCIKYISGTIAYEALCFTFHVNIYENGVPRVYSLSVGSIGNIYTRKMRIRRNSWKIRDPFRTAEQFVQTRKNLSRALRVASGSEQAGEWCWSWIAGPLVMQSAGSGVTRQVGHRGWRLNLEQQVRKNIRRTWKSYV